MVPIVLRNVARTPVSQHHDHTCVLCAQGRFIVWNTRPVTCELTQERNRMCVTLTSVARGLVGVMS